MAKTKLDIWQTNDKNWLEIADPALLQQAVLEYVVSKFAKMDTDLTLDSFLKTAYTLMETSKFDEFFFPDDSDVNFDKFIGQRSNFTEL